MKIQTSEKLIKQSIEENWIKSLAVYFFLKLKFKNSCLYNFENKKSKIAKLVKVSPYSLVYHIKVLETKGLAYYHNDNLILKSIHKVKKQLREKQSCTLQAPDNSSLKEIEYILFSKDLNRKARQQAYKIKKTQHERRYTGDDAASDEFSLFSFRNLADSWYCSTKKVSNIFKYLTGTKFVKLRTISKNYGKTSVKRIIPEFWPGFGHPYLSKKNELIVIYGTAVNFLDFPIVA